MKIAYYPLGDRTVASSRLRVWKIADELKRRGHEVCFPQDSFVLDEYDLVVVQKRMDLASQMNRFKGHNWPDRWKGKIPVIFDIDDLNGNIPDCDQLTVGSVKLQEAYGGEYIPDALDIEDSFVKKITHNEKLTRVCWFGLACNLYHAEHVKNACQELGLQFVVITDIDGKHDYPKWPGVEYRKWSLETVDSDIVGCDLVVCPYVFNNTKWSNKWVEAKGENRILKAWGLGMPVAGTPIRSYIQHCLYCNATTPAEWKFLLDVLRWQSLRRDNANNGLPIAMNHHASQIADRWLSVFNKVTACETI